tara:strand:+ start:1266 stop:2042 length:777 start_codon:yes stop_codon:yes gene_type:complete
MEIIIENVEKAQAFVEIFQNMKSFTNAISIMFKQDKVYVQGMDNAHVSMFELSLMNTWFDGYKVDKDVVLGINALIFAKMLSTHKTSQKIVLTLNNVDNLDISYLSEDKEFNKDFRMPLIEFENELMGITEFDYDLEFTMASKKLKSTIDEMVNFGENVNIDFKDDRIVLHVESDSAGIMNTYIDIDDVDECIISEDDDISCSFTLKYMQYMSNYFKVAKNVQLKFSKQYPMMCKYMLDENCENNYMRFYLAPKISDN